MKKDSKNQTPIFRFLAKHKWRIILPLIFALFYWAIPRYQSFPVGVQQDLFIKSSVYSQVEIKEEVESIRDKVFSNEFLKNIVSKYDLYKNEQDESVKIYKLKNIIHLETEREEIIEGIGIHFYMFMKREDSEHIAEISNDIGKQFDENNNFHIDKYVYKPYDANPYRNYVFFGALLQGFTLLTIPLILIWEIPNMFYSPRTKESIFEPLKSDWQDELYQAKLNNQTFKTFEINLKYSFAFLSAMIQKSPFGDLLEYVRKFAS